MLNLQSRPPQTTLEQNEFLPLKKIQKNVNLKEKVVLNNEPRNDSGAFWQVWLCHQDYLYGRCQTWVGGNRTDAEEAFSRAMLKAWDKWPNRAKKITNPKAWLTRLTYNLCMDLHRERKRGARNVEWLEEMAVGDREAALSSPESPESAILDRELGTYISNAVRTLPLKLREPFELRFYREMSYPDIAQHLALSRDNVYKRIQKARDILKKQLKKYCSGSDTSVVEERSLSPQADWETTGSTIVTHIAERINYEVTATCLEELPHTWYGSLGLLG